jgi:cardiolipin synthase
MNPNVVSTCVLAAHWLIILGLSLRVIVRRRPVGVSLAWLAVIFSIPFAGAAIYLLFGETRLGKARRRRIAALHDEVQPWQEAIRQGPDAVLLPLDAAAGPLDRHGQRVVGYPALAGNMLVLLDDFHAIFDAIIRDIQAAQRSCNLGFYIWHEGGRADEVVDALVQAAGRGVACRVSADALGSKAFLGGGRVEMLRRAGVEVVTSLPTGVVHAIFARADLRNHRKIVAVDDRIAYTGSQNLVDPRFFKQDAGVGQWVDAMVRVEGPAVSPLATVFAIDWCVERGEPFQPPGLPAAVNPDGGAVVQVVPSGPGMKPEAIHQLLLTTIYAARKELVMTTPYFVPDDAMITAILSAALRGVEVTIIVPAQNDSRLVRYASVAHFDDLLSAGVRIARFHGGLLHTKSIALDGEVSVFGSVNLDMRSLWLNFEISLFVYQAEFTEQLRAIQNGYLEQSDFVDLAEWRKRPRRTKLAEDTLRLLGPLL